MKKYILVVLIALLLFIPMPVQATNKPPQGINRVYLTYTPHVTYIQWMNYRPSVHTVYSVMYLCIKKICTTRYTIIWRKYVPFGFVRVADRLKINNYLVQ